MNKAVGLFSAVGVGAGLMYLFDPDRGKRRRVEIGNKAKHINRIAADASVKTGRDVRNHLLGAVSQLESLVRHENVADDTLQARVRSKLGRIVSHPHAIEVKVADGVVRLSGPIFTDEAHPLLDCVVAIRGVRNIENCLELHDNAGDIPALQGGRRRHGERFGPFKSIWSPTTRLIGGLAGGALTLYGVKRRGALGSAISSLGFAVVTRALTNIEGRRLIGMNGSTPEVEIEKTISVNAPIDKVFMYWSHPENFPEFMSHVLEVRRIDDGIYHWKVGGPAGLQVGWYGAITQLDFNKTLAWKSLAGSMVSQKGITRFSSNPDGSTRIEVKMSYQPPAGIVGHEIAKWFGADPKHEMDDDLMRMKTFIETGVHPHDAMRQSSTGEQAAAT
jgi:uncharacterized membrane protein